MSTSGITESPTHLKTSLEAGNLWKRNTLDYIGVEVNGSWFAIFVFSCACVLELVRLLFMSRVP